MGKKNLEQLFKDTFTEFQRVPDESVWKSIEASLDRKKKKRAIPIWWRLGGVAAVLAILFYVVNPFDGSDNETQITVTETESQENTIKNDSTTENQNEIDLPPNANAEQKLAESSNANEENTVGSTSKSSQNDATNSINKNQSLKLNEQTRVANAEQQEGNPKKDRVYEDKVDQGIAAINNVDDKKHATKENDKTQQQDNVFESASKEEAVAQTEEKTEEFGKKSIYEAIEEQEELAVAENTGSKWSIGPSVAPVYFDATGEGSPIHSNFASSPKSGNVNLSYGLTVAYDIGKRLKVRSGVHKVNFGYDTNDISASSSLEASTNELIDNISYNQTSRNLVLQNKNAIPSADTFGDVPFSEIAANETPGVDGSLVQQLGYIEVPLELSYAIIDKKFGLNIIGGVSSLFLVEGDNSITVEADNLVTEIGEANNANSLNFSTNVGVGLNYEFTPKVQFNIEPVFKYQLNTFSETAGTFRPFSVGVYSGVSFRF